MSYVLWGDPGSGSFMIEAALAEAGQAVELNDVSIAGERQRGTEYLAVNPSGKVPALRWPDGTLMVQSGAILLALAEAHPEAGLLPAPGAPGRREALRWLLHLMAEIYPLIELHDYPARFVPEPRDDEAVRAVVQERRRERWRMAEAASAPDGSFLASGFSALDLALTVMGRWDNHEGWRDRHCPKLSAIDAAVERRAATASVWRRHFEGRD